MLKKILTTIVVIAINATTLAYTQTPTTASTRLNNTLVRKNLMLDTSLNKTKFESIGPNIMGGRVVDIEVNPDDPTEFYVAYATGGLWHTRNNGQSFTPIFDNEEVIGIGDIAVNWVTRTIWVGTGEVNSSRSSYAGIGVYKSYNNGKTWQYLGLPESHHIGKIILHPSDNNIAWVAVLGHLYSSNKERGVYKTIDGGNTWKQTLYVDENTGAVDLALNSKNSNEMYATMWFRKRSSNEFIESGKTSGIYKSIDGGDNWFKISNPTSGFMQGDKIGRIGIDVFAKNPNIVYAVVDNNMIQNDTSSKKNLIDSNYSVNQFKNITNSEFENLSNKWLDSFLYKNNFPAQYSANNVKQMVSTGKIKPTSLWDYLDNNDGFKNNGIIGCEIYRSDDAGIHWKKMNKDALKLYSTYGYYFGKVFISPTNDKKVIITGVNILLSQDSGITFKSIDQPNVHGDHHCVWINPKRDSHFIIGHDGGCNITYDNGQNWFYANSPAVGQYYGITTDDEKPYNVYGGLQDNQVWYGPSNFKSSTAWQYSGEYPYKILAGGDGMQAQVDTRDNKTVYTGSQFGFYSRIDKSNRRNRISVRPYHLLGEMPLRFNWQTPILLSTHNQDIFYIGANRLYRSLNKGDSLIAMGPDLSNGKINGNVPYGTITTLTESPLRMGLMYIGTDDGNIQITTDGGYTYKQLNQKNNLEKDKMNTNKLWVTKLIASVHKEARVYVALNGYRFDDFNPYLFISEDYGAHWKNISSNLPIESINVIKEDPYADSIIYVGTDGGLYISFNKGLSFSKFGMGIPASVPVHDIAIQKRENEIIIATHGRSLYKAKLNLINGILNKEVNNKLNKKEIEVEN